MKHFAPLQIMIMDNLKKHSLGSRAFTLFFLKRITIPFFLFAFTFAAWYSERWVPLEYLPFADYAAKILLYLSIAFFVLVLLRTYLEYRYHTYTFTEEAFIITYGYIIRNEIAAVYHQIQNVNIKRSPLDRLVGVSQVVIFMTGSDRETSRTQIILPSIGKTKARLVQKELLMRARKHAIPYIPN